MEGTYPGLKAPNLHESIKRARPPPAPVGIDRIDEDGRLRWIADDFRFPPYQYHFWFIIWVSGRCRLMINRCN